MSRYLVGRLAQSVLVLLGVSFIVFVVSHLTGDPAVLMLPPDASSEQLETFRRQMGYDRPIIVQYAEFLGRMLQGDFGRSLWTQESTVSLILARLPATLELAGAAMFLSMLIALPVGIYSATNRNSPLDRGFMSLTVLGQALPVFWLGLMLIMVFSVSLELLPVSGRGTFQHLILPTVTLSAYFTARNARMIRSSMLEVLGQEYIRTARAKGLHERVVLWRHAFRNALIPIVTLIGLQFGVLLGGTVITETVFAWPGIGRLILQAIVHRDFPLLQAAVFFVSLVFVTINLVVDVLYTAIDPLIRLEN